MPRAVDACCHAHDQLCAGHQASTNVGTCSWLTITGPCATPQPNMLTVSRSLQRMHRHWPRCAGLALLDVEATYLVVLAYRYTRYRLCSCLVIKCFLQRCQLTRGAGLSIPSLTSVTLLDCTTIPGGPQGFYFHACTLLSCHTACCMGLLPSLIRTATKSGNHLNIMCLQQCRIDTGCQYHCSAMYVMGRGCNFCG